MKSDELMIGDWVFLVDPDTKKREFTQVRLSDLSDAFILGLFEPIPITPEILLKVGFCTSQKNDMHGWLTDSMTDGKLFRVEYNKPTAQSGKVLGVQFLGNCGYAEKTYNLPLPTYVHELQHALRQCKIGKKIEL